MSTGFRAPSLGQSFFSSTATNFVNLGQGLVPVESLTLPVDSAPAKVLGAVPLEPEQSINASAGVVVMPLEALTLAIDYYRVAIDDRIVLSGNFTAPPIAALLAPFGANSARFFTNAIDTRTNGVDVAATYRVTMDSAGTMFLRAGYNNTRTKVVGFGVDAAAAGGLRIGAVRSHRTAKYRVRPAQGQPASWRRLAAEPVRGQRPGGALRRVLQLHAQSR